ncbi:peptide ABC transporter ATP-binding protein [Limnohabitans sp. T6-5]|uniref:ABC transporter ATP-binding protein n=1 Tax=Limnohabitans sp. T6-5 TaxID=1100724 RepID=UPI000D35D7C4|nr:ABC transporter ATP-binding protein [Limnohabitans sp. T6-5]PUE06834.1 peptide ABC transporter ATP-binding protein [Limnohabitans sp. T6-5]
MKPMLRLENLTVEFGRGAQRVRAVHEVSFDIAQGETLGLVGESGSGKSSLGRAVLQLIPVAGGSVHFEGQELVGLSSGKMRSLRRHVQMVFQDPSLNPRQRAGDMLSEVLSTHALHTGAERGPRIAQLLDLVGLKTEHAERFPHEFSGGQKQRLGIARALAVEPSFIVADEPLSALDMSIQAQIVNLLIRLREQLGLTLLFISHDLDMVQYLCDRVVVLYLGRVMEIASTVELFSSPAHPYTRALLSAAPVPDPDQAPPQVVLHGDPPSPLNPPSGCVFRTRCPHALAACAETTPELRPTSAGRLLACWRHDELN